jgi:threonyl-tRNA synthetase
VDYIVPDRLDATYVGEDSARHRPVMLHRAILGSFERFIGILIEHHAGRFPLWLAPVQVVVASIVTDAAPYAEEVAATLRAAGLEVRTDTRNEKINAKVREHSLAHVPVLAVVGRKEAETGQVALRRLGGADQTIMGVSEAASMLADEALPPDLKRANAK